MKQRLLTFLLLLPFVFAAAQDCQPDMTYADSTAGVYPLPYDADLNPGGGITQCAVIGQFFQFDLTVVVGDTLNLGPISQPLDSIRITAVEGLPTGISYGCNPTNCTFVKNTMGCAAIYGTATSANAPGEYDLTIKGFVYLNGSSLPLPLTFPNAALAPGKYTIFLLGSSSDPCQFTSVNHLKKQVRILTAPNPSSGFTNVLVDSKVAGDFSFRVVDLLGKTVEERKVQLFTGENRLTFDGSHLPNGMYLLMLQNGQGYVTQKLTIQH